MSGYNTNFFKELNQHSAYVLGYIWADGSVGQRRGKNAVVSMNCSDQDREILDYVKEVTGATTKISLYKDKRYSDKKYYNLTLCNLELVEDVVEMHGVVPRKSYVDPPYKNIPVDYFPDFFRGYFDGDGSWAKSACSFFGVRAGLIGSVRFIEGLASQLVAAAHISYPSVFSENGGKWARMYVTGRERILTLARWMYYSPEAFCLSRKRKRIEEALSSKGMSLFG